MKNLNEKKKNILASVLCILVVTLMVVVISKFLSSKLLSKCCYDDSSCKNVSSNEFLPNSMLLSSGAYECGKDFKEGTYDITTASGQGLLFCDGKIKLLMGVGDIEKYQVNCSGVYFNKGEIIHISDDLVLIMVKVE